MKQLPKPAVDHLRDVVENGGSAALTQAESETVLDMYARYPALRIALLQAALLVDTLATSASQILPYETLNMLRKEAAEWTILLHGGEL